VSILDSAVAPQAPNTNAAPRVVAMGVFGSFACAVLLALLLDRFDKRFRYPEQVSRDLRLPILGVVPAMERGDRSAQAAADVI
jgi:capsular polysaccharide biosynthesis protein